MNDKIYPLAYTLAPEQSCTLYYLGFPAEWKEALLNIARQNSPRFKDEYGLPTNALKKLVDSWMEGIVALAPLKKGSQDAHWLTACRPYTEKDLRALCDIIKVWVKATYLLAPKASVIVKELAKKFCSSMNADAFSGLQSQETVCLTLADGTVREEAYQALPLLVINRLLDKEILLNGQKLHLCYAAKNQLISDPLTDLKSQHSYSFVFDFSVQTTPPHRKALLLCQMSIRRWVPDRYKEGKNADKLPFLAENITAHCKVSNRKYCQIPLVYDYSARRPGWKAQDQECYNIWGYTPLPEAEQLLMEPAAYAGKILLPYKNGLSGFVISKIGTGVSVRDKAALHQAIAALLGDMICGHPEAQRVRLRGQNFHVYDSPQRYESREDFRAWVRQCAESDQITFELYVLWKDPVQQELLHQVKAKLEQDFGPEHEGSCLKVQYLCKEAGPLAEEMADDRRATKITRCDEIVRQLSPAEGAVACIFVLPGREQYTKGDPKQVLRNAFARTGRVVQFITPEDNASKNKIENAVYDLYRQLGVVALPDLRKNVPALAHTPCEGMHLCTQVHGVANKGRFLPLYVTVDLMTGQTRVTCDAFSERTVSYRKACLEMAQLFWKEDLEQRCMDASRAPAKQTLLTLKNRYYQKQDSVLLVVQADGNTRAVWGGISDKEIGSYTVTEAYCPESINAGMPKSPSMLSLLDSGVRIMRIRSNQEVPDYFTEQYQKEDKEPRHRSASGVFQHEDVYWGIHARPNDPQYTSSFKNSRIDHPQQRFAEKDMIELYPLQLQPGDDAASWVFYTNALRHIPIQYNQSTVLPLPLHLAKGLEEYLFEG